MDILRAIIDARTAALDDGVLKLLASQLNGKPPVFKPRQTRARTLRGKSPMLAKHEFKSRA
jgi:hypothetical protein